MQSLRNTGNPALHFVTGRPAWSVILVCYSARARKAMRPQSLIHLSAFRLWVCEESNSTTRHFQSSWRKPRHPLPSQPHWSAHYVTVLTFSLAGRCSGGSQRSYHIHCLVTLTTRDHNTLSGVQAACGADRSRRPPLYSSSYFANQTRPFSFLASQPVITKDLVFPLPSHGFYPSPSDSHTHAKLSRTPMAPHLTPPPWNPKSPLNWLTKRSVCNIWKSRAVLYGRRTLW